MSCTCANLADVEKVERHIAFFESLPVLETGNWVKLCQCLSCNQLWSVDEWDKGAISFARKRRNRKNWAENDIEAPKLYLLQVRGVQEDVICMQASYYKPALNGVVFGVDHFYKMGWRE